MRFKCRISHVPNLIQELNAYEVRLLPIFDCTSRIFDRSSTVALQVELQLCRILSINYVINVFLNMTALVIGLKPISMTTHALTVTSHALNGLSFR